MRDLFSVNKAKKKKVVAHWQCYRLNEEMANHRYELQQPIQTVLDHIV